MSGILLKIVFVGDCNVGKSNLLQRFTDDTFSESKILSIGVDFKIRTIEWEGKSIRLQIWDTRGQERFKTITSSVVQNTQGILFVYDVTRRATFSNLNNWVSQLDRGHRQNFGKILVGNKCDLVEQREVDYKTGKAYADSLGIPFFETSAKYSIHVEEAFFKLVTEINSAFPVLGIRKEMIKDNIETKEKTPCSLQ